MFILNAIQSQYTPCCLITGGYVHEWYAAREVGTAGYYQGLRMLCLRFALVVTDILLGLKP